MDIKHVIGVGLSIGLFGAAQLAHADTFLPNFGVAPVHAVGAGNTAGSFAASAMMGGAGHSNLALFANWESQITTQCAAASGATLWPGNCTPTGMAAAMASLTGRTWIQSQFVDTQQAAALTTILGSLQFHGSPAIVPIYGQADHWVAVTQVTAANVGGVWNIQQVKFYDGGPITGIDGGFNSYQDGLVSYGAGPWKTVYFRVIESINPACDPCTADPWYNKYVIMWEPPPGEEHPQIANAFPKAPGVAASMSELKAQSLVWQSLAANGIDKDPELWNAVRGGIAGKAYEVNGVAPDGARWDYYLVPILGAGNVVKGLVTLGADDGAYESLQVPAHPQQFTALSEGQAQAIARTQLGKGEALSAGILTWDPRSNTPFAKAPTFPYYEYGVLNGVKQVAVIRVSFNKGAVVRVAG